MDTIVARQLVDQILETAGSIIDYEIVVSTPVAFEAPRTRIVLERTPRGPGEAYNEAAGAAEGEILVQMTDRKRLRKGWLEAAVGTVIERDAGMSPFVACLPMQDPAFGDAFVGTAFGRLYPWCCAFRRTVLDRVGAFCDTAFRNSFLDVDFGLRVWAAGGRCEIVPGGAWYEHVPSAANIRTSEKHIESDFARLCERWYPSFGTSEAFAAVRHAVGDRLLPWHVCHDVPATFFPHFVKNRTIMELSDEWPLVAPFLRSAVRAIHVDGTRPPGSVIANPTLIPEWLYTIDAARRKVAENQTGITPNGSL